MTRVLSMDEQEWREMSRDSASYVKPFDWDRSAGLLEAVLFDETVV